MDGIAFAMVLVGAAMGLSIGMTTGYYLGRIGYRMAQDRAVELAKSLETSEAKCRRMQSYCLDRAEELDASFAQDDHELRKSLREVAAS